MKRFWIWFSGYTADEKGILVEMQEACHLIDIIVSEIQQVDDDIGDGPHYQLGALVDIETVGYVRWIHKRIELRNRA